jgi:uncharacterized protein (TIGR00251 family)
LERDFIFSQNSAKIKINMLLKIKVIPKSSQDKIIRQAVDNFKIKITDAPEKGKANKKVIQLLAKEFGVSQSNVIITHGLTNRNKSVRINK